MKIAFIINSCDNYSDLWPTTFNSYNRYWKDLPFDSYLITNNLKSPNPRFKSLKVGKDETWSSNTLSALNQLPQYDYVIMTLEDLILTSDVNNKQLVKTINYFLKENGTYLSLINEPKGNIKHNSFYNKIGKFQIYRPTTTFAIWHRESLLNLLKLDESAWEFEKIGVDRTREDEKFFSVKKNHFHYVNSVVKGKWTIKSLIILRAKKIPITHSREIQNVKDTLWDIIYVETRRLVFRILPIKWLKHLRKYFKY